MKLSAYDVLKLRMQIGKPYQICLRGISMMPVLHDGDMGSASA